MAGLRGREPAQTGVARAPWRPTLMAVLAFCGPVVAHASLFSDDEARKAILDLRSRLTQTDARIESQQAEIQSLRKALLDLNSQLDQHRADLARSNGQKEQLARELSELQRQQRDIVAGVDERVRRLEPIKVSVDGREFQAEPGEKRQYEEAVARLRGGDFEAAAQALNQFIRRHPGSGYLESAQFWLGNALYGKRDYREAINAFRVTARATDHPRAAEALLAIGNCQLEMKDAKAARVTFQELIKAFPDADASKAARERLSALR